MAQVITFADIPLDVGSVRRTIVQGAFPITYDGNIYTNDGLITNIGRTRVAAELGNITQTLTLFLDDEVRKSLNTNSYRNRVATIYKGIWNTETGSFENDSVKILYQGYLDTASTPADNGTVEFIITSLLSPFKQPSDIVASPGIHSRRILDGVFGEINATAAEALSAPSSYDTFLKNAGGSFQDFIFGSEEFTKAVTKPIYTTVPRTGISGFFGKARRVQTGEEIIFPEISDNPGSRLEVGGNKFQIPHVIGRSGVKPAIIAAWNHPTTNDFSATRQTYGETWRGFASNSQGTLRGLIPEHRFATVVYLVHAGEIESLNVFVDGLEVDTASRREISFATGDTDPTYILDDDGHRAVAIEVVWGSNTQTSPVNWITTSNGAWTSSDRGLGHILVAVTMEATQDGAVQRTPNIEFEVTNRLLRSDDPSTINIAETRQFELNTIDYSTGWETGSELNTFDLINFAGTRNWSMIGNVVRLKLDGAGNANNRSNLDSIFNITQINTSYSGQHNVTNDRESRQLRINIGGSFAFFTIGYVHKSLNNVYSFTVSANPVRYAGNILTTTADFRIEVISNDVSTGLLNERSANQNPGRAVVDYLTSPLYGPGIDESNVDIESFLVADAKATNVPKYLNGVLQESDSFEEYATQLAESGGLVVYEENGKIKCDYTRYVAPSEIKLTFNESNAESVNIIDSRSNEKYNEFSVSVDRYLRAPNRVPTIGTQTFNERDKDFLELEDNNIRSIGELTSNYLSVYYEEDENGEVEQAYYEITGITDVYESFSRFLMMQSRYFQEVEIVTLYEFAHTLRIGDFFDVDYKDYGWYNRIEPEEAVTSGKVNILVGTANSNEITLTRNSTTLTNGEIRRLMPVGTDLSFGGSGATTASASIFTVIGYRETSIILDAIPGYSTGSTVFFPQRNVFNTRRFKVVEYEDNHDGTITVIGQRHTNQIFSLPDDLTNNVVETIAPVVSGYTSADVGRTTLAGTSGQSSRTDIAYAENLPEQQEISMSGTRSNINNSSRNRSFDIRLPNTFNSGPNTESAIVNGSGSDNTFNSFNTGIIAETFNATIPDFDGNSQTTNIANSTMDLTVTNVDRTGLSASGANSTSVYGTYLSSVSADYNTSTDVLFINLGTSGGGMPRTLNLTNFYRLEVNGVTFSFWGSEYIPDVGVTNAHIEGTTVNFVNEVTALEYATSNDTTVDLYEGDTLAYSNTGQVRITPKSQTGITENGTVTSDTLSFELSSSFTYSPYTFPPLNITNVTINGAPASSSNSLSVIAGSYEEDRKYSSEYYDSVGYLYFGSNKTINSTTGTLSGVGFTDDGTGSTLPAGTTFTFNLPTRTYGVNSVVNLLPKRIANLNLSVLPGDPGYTRYKRRDIGIDTSLELSYSGSGPANITASNNSNFSNLGNLGEISRVASTGLSNVSIPSGSYIDEEVNSVYLSSNRPTGSVTFTTYGTKNFEYSNYFDVDDLAGYPIRLWFAPVNYSSNEIGNNGGVQYVVGLSAVGAVSSSDISDVCYFTNIYFWTYGVTAQISALSQLFDDLKDEDLGTLYTRTVTGVTGNLFNYEFIPTGTAVNANLTVTGGNTGNNSSNASWTLDNIIIDAWSYQGYSIAELSHNYESTVNSRPADITVTSDLIDENGNSVSLGSSDAPWIVPASVTNASGLSWSASNITKIHSSNTWEFLPNPGYSGGQLTLNTLVGNPVTSVPVSLRNWSIANVTAIGQAQKYTITQIPSGSSLSIRGTTTGSPVEIVLTANNPTTTFNDNNSNRHWTAVGLIGENNHVRYKLVSDGSTTGIATGETASVVIADTGGDITLDSNTLSTEFSDNNTGRTWSASLSRPLTPVSFSFDPDRNNAFYQVDENLTNVSLGANKNTSQALSELSSQISNISPLISVTNIAISDDNAPAPGFTGIRVDLGTNLNILPEFDIFSNDSSQDVSTVTTFIPSYEDGVNSTYIITSPGGDVYSLQGAVVSVNAADSDFDFITREIARIITDREETSATLNYNAETLGSKITITAAGTGATSGNLWSIVADHGVTSSNPEYTYDSSTNTLTLTPASATSSPNQDLNYTLRDTTNNKIFSFRGTDAGTTLTSLLGQQEVQFLPYSGSRVNFVGNSLQNEFARILLDEDFDSGPTAKYETNVQTLSSPVVYSAGFTGTTTSTALYLDADTNTLTSSVPSNTAAIVTPSYNSDTVSEPTVTWTYSDLESYAWATGQGNSNSFPKLVVDLGSSYDSYPSDFSSSSTSSLYNHGNRFVVTELVGASQAAKDSAVILSAGNFRRIVIGFSDPSVNPDDITAIKLYTRTGSSNTLEKQGWEIIRGSSRGTYTGTTQSSTEISNSGSITNDAGTYNLCNNTTRSFWGISGRRVRTLDLNLGATPNGYEGSVVYYSNFPFANTGITTTDLTIHEDQNWSIDVSESSTNYYIGAKPIGITDGEVVVTTPSTSNHLATVKVDTHGTESVSVRPSIEGEFSLITDPETNWIGGYDIDQLPRINRTSNSFFEQFVLADENNYNVTADAFDEELLIFPKSADWPDYNQSSFINKTWYVGAAPSNVNIPGSTTFTITSSYTFDTTVINGTRVSDTLIEDVMDEVGFDISVAADSSNPNLARVTYTNNTGSDVSMIRSTGGAYPYHEVEEFVSDGSSFSIGYDVSSASFESEIRVDSPNILMKIPGVDSSDANNHLATFSDGVGGNYSVYNSFREFLTEIEVTYLASDMILTFDAKDNNYTDIRTVTVDSEDTLPYTVLAVKADGSSNLTNYEIEPSAFQTLRVRRTAQATLKSGIADKLANSIIIGFDRRNPNLLPKTGTWTAVEARDNNNNLVTTSINAVTVYDVNDFLVDPALYFYAKYGNQFTSDIHRRLQIEFANTPLKTVSMDVVGDTDARFETNASVTRFVEDAFTNFADTSATPSKFSTGTTIRNGQAMSAISVDNIQVDGSANSGDVVLPRGTVITLPPNTNLAPATVVDPLTPSNSSTGYEANKLVLLKEVTINGTSGSIPIDSWATFPDIVPVVSSNKGASVNPATLSNNTALSAIVRAPHIVSKVLLEDPEGRYWEFNQKTGTSDIIGDRTLSNYWSGWADKVNSPGANNQNPGRSFMFTNNYPVEYKTVNKMDLTYKDLNSNQDSSSDVFEYRESISDPILTSIASSSTALATNLDSINWQFFLGEVRLSGQSAATAGTYYVGNRPNGVSGGTIIGSSPNSRHVATIEITEAASLRRVKLTATSSSFENFSLEFSDGTTAALTSASDVVYRDILATTTLSFIADSKGTATFSYDPDVDNSIYTNSVATTSIPFNSSASTTLTTIANAITGLDASITWDSVVGTDGSNRYVDIDLGTTANISQQLILTGNGATNTTVSLIESDGISSTSNALATTVTLQDYNSSQTTVRSFQADDLTAPTTGRTVDVAEWVKDQINSNNETPVNFTATNESADSRIEATADVASAVTGLFTVTVNNQGVSNAAVGDFDFGTTTEETTGSVTTWTVVKSSFSGNDIIESDNASGVLTNGQQGNISAATATRLVEGRGLVGNTNADFVSGLSNAIYPSGFVAQTYDAATPQATSNAIGQRVVVWNENSGEPAVSTSTSDYEWSPFRNRTD
jgi:hypothetical protein